jgi:Protein of unknown function (DUF3108)
VQKRALDRAEGGLDEKGEVFVWITDDGRKVPALMKSKIKVGSCVFALVDMNPGTHKFMQ